MFKKPLDCCIQTFNQHLQHVSARLATRVERKLYEQG